MVWADPNIVGANCGMPLSSICRRQVPVPTATITISNGDPHAPREVLHTAISHCLLARIALDRIIGGKGASALHNIVIDAAAAEPHGSLAKALEQTHHPRILARERLGRERERSRVLDFDRCSNAAWH